MKFYGAEVRERKRPKPGTLPCPQRSVQVKRNRNRGLKPIISIAWLSSEIASALWASVGQFYKVGTRITSEITMQMKRENSGSILFSMSVGTELRFYISPSSIAPAAGLSKWTIRILSCLFSVWVMFSGLHCFTLSSIGASSKAWLWCAHPSQSSPKVKRNKNLSTVQSDSHRWQFPCRAAMVPNTLQDRLSCTFRLHGHCGRWEGVCCWITYDPKSSFFKMAMNIYSSCGVSG